MAPTVAIRKEKRPTVDAADNGGIQKPRRGPKPKPLSEKVKGWKFEKPKRRQERSYTRERKIEVIMFLLNHRVPDTREVMPRRRYGQYDVENEPPQENPDGTFTYFRAPTYTEASEWWKIPTATICSWWDKREAILAGSGIELPAKKVHPEGASPPNPRPPKKRGPAPNPPVEWFQKNAQNNSIEPPSTAGTATPTEPATSSQQRPAPAPAPLPQAKQAPPATQPRSQPQPPPSPGLPPYHVCYAGPLPAGGTYLDHPSQVANWPPPEPGQPQCWVVVYYGPPPPPYGNFPIPGTPGGPPLPPQPFPPLLEVPRQAHHGVPPPMPGVPSAPPPGPQQASPPLPQPPPQPTQPRAEPFPGANAYRVQDPPPSASGTKIIQPRPGQQLAPSAVPVNPRYIAVTRVPGAPLRRLAPVPIPLAPVIPPVTSPAAPPVAPRVQRAWESHLPPRRPVQKQLSASSTRPQGRPHKTPVTSPVAHPPAPPPKSTIPTFSIHDKLTPTESSSAEASASAPAAAAAPVSSVPAATPPAEDGLPYDAEPTSQTPVADENQDEAEGEDRSESPQQAAAESEGGSGESTPYATPRTAPERTVEPEGQSGPDETSPPFTEGEDEDEQMTGQG
ncbi:hypothetical protein OQA88_6715 [Cercophora sp. LCS_1]